MTRTKIPFMEGHAHPIFGGRESQGPQVTGLKSVPEILAEVKRYAQSNPTESWIIGSSYEAALVEGGDFESKWLDEVVSDRPVLLRAMDFHTVWVNSKALEIAGINKETADPNGGSIARDAAGNPKGTLREPAAISLIEKLIPPRSIEQDLAALDIAYKKYQEHGVVAIQDAWVDEELIPVYEKALKEDRIRIHTNLALLAKPENWKELLNAALELKAKLTGKNLTCLTIKFLTDGALSAGTAFLLEPYLDNPQSYGLQIWDDAELNSATEAFDALGFQVHLHAIGDAAIRQSLNAIENLIQVNGKRDRRPVITHAQLIHPEDLPRFAQLQVIANMQPLWCYLDPMNKELILPRIGEERNNRQYQLRSLLDSGARVSFGSDWPVTSEDTNLALKIPVTRLAPGDKSGEPWNIKEAITLAEAIKCYTSEVAYQLFLD